jgi:hypothetical protein
MVGFPDIGIFARDPQIYDPKRMVKVNSLDNMKFGMVAVVQLVKSLPQHSIPYQPILSILILYHRQSKRHLACIAPHRQVLVAQFYQYL